MTLQDEIRLGFAQIRMLADPAVHDTAVRLEELCLAGVAPQDEGRYSVRTDRLTEVNQILDELGEPQTTVEELERTGVWDPSWLGLNFDERHL